MGAVMSSKSTPGVPSIQAGADGDKSPASASVTPIGVDVGTNRLVTVASAENGVADAVAVDGDPVRDLYAAFTKVTHKLQRRPHSAECLGDVVARFWPRFRRRFREAATAVLDYARQRPRPVVVLEELPCDRQPLVACRHGRTQPAVWIPPAVQAVVARRCVDAGIPVASVDPHATSRLCHECGQRGELDGTHLVCETSTCPVDEVCRDQSAAVSIAKRGLRNQ